jgi:hypothetical protein
MRIVIISNLHANAEALAALADGIRRDLITVLRTGAVPR